MPRILFIDEEKDVLNAFKGYVKKATTKKIEVITSFPCPTIKGMITQIIKWNPDAIISDFNLNRNKKSVKYSVNYDGVSLIQTFREIRENFPCFILTFFDSNAIDVSDDVNIIYGKEIFNEPANCDTKITFIERVIKQIECYKSKIEKAEKELKNLVSKKCNLTVQEEERIIQLDTFLEKSVDKRTVVPQNLKKVSNEQKLFNLLKRTDEFISKIK